MGPSARMVAPELVRALRHRQSMARERRVCHFAGGGTHPAGASGQVASGLAGSA